MQKLRHAPIFVTTKTNGFPNPSSAVLRHGNGSRASNTHTSASARSTAAARQFNVGSTNVGTSSSSMAFAFRFPFARTALLPGTAIIPVSCSVVEGSSSASEPDDSSLSTGAALRVAFAFLASSLRLCFSARSWRSRSRQYSGRNAVAKTVTCRRASATSAMISSLNGKLLGTPGSCFFSETDMSWRGRVVLKTHALDFHWGFFFAAFFDFLRPSEILCLIFSRWCVATRLLVSGPQRQKDVLLQRDAACSLLRIRGMADH